MSMEQSRYLASPSNQERETEDRWEQLDGAKLRKLPGMTTCVPAFRCKARTAYKSELHTHVIYIFMLLSQGFDTFSYFNLIFLLFC